jgi:hypothetical protein
MGSDAVAAASCLLCRGNRGHSSKRAAELATRSIAIAGLVLFAIGGNLVLSLLRI